MPAPGETDLATMLAALAVERRAGSFTYVGLATPSAEQLALASATIVEDEETTLVVASDIAARHGLPVVGEFAWLTVSVASSLDAVGLTAVLSRRLADAGIPCNVLAGLHHDHLLVPLARADEAIAALQRSDAPTS